MVRRYTDQPVDPGALERVLDAACRGPSAGFSQGQRLVVVTDADRRRVIAREACAEGEYIARGFDPWISSAPVLLVPAVRVDDYRERYAEPDKAASPDPDDWPVPFWWVDAGTTLMLVLLAAVDEGLGAGFLGADEGALRRILGLPSDVRPVGVVTLGHPAPDRPSASLRRGRRPRAEVVRRETWGGPAG